MAWGGDFLNHLVGRKPSFYFLDIGGWLRFRGIEILAYFFAKSIIG